MPLAFTQRADDCSSTPSTIQEISGGFTPSAALAAIAEELNHPQPETVVSGGLQILEDLRNRQVILGTAKADN